jgi:ribosome-binding ATPase
MEIILIGLPQSGKTTIFNLLTEQENSKKHGGRIEYNLSRVHVSDQRLDKICEICPSKIKTPSQIDFIDMAGISADDAMKGKRLPEGYIHAVRNGDAFVIVLQSPVIRGEADEEKGNDILTKELDLIESELLLSDLEVLENKLTRLSKEIKLGKTEHKSEYEILNRCFEHLNNSKPLNSLELTQNEEKTIKSYAFLTHKPKLILLNLDESEIGKDKYTLFKDVVQKKGTPLVTLCGKLESEIAELPDDERMIFMKSSGIDVSGKDNLIMSSYKLLNLITFFTMGEDENKAWPLRKGLFALDAAGKIHSDIQRGFIRAEVIRLADLVELGSEAAVKKAGKLKSEGKTYIVEDGDIIEFKFNV